ncbi:hypothetical protein GDO86_013229 [Hymenochirus boettgeri]|uniref:C2 domain-containing protein n=1 Tax=Hymenochirus boettgeri TaxID=247094 RepID=A0A8T2IQH7_9PIPI|nr:hypothetical protein GDO86_013229 [Hymenochirus boettgeri]
MLKIIVESAVNIPKTKLGKPDPIVTINFKGEKKKTKAVNSELNPTWNELLEFDLKGIPLDYSSSIEVIVKDWETIGKDKFIGSTTISLKEFTGGQNRSLPFKGLSLANEKGQPTGATIDIMISYEPPANSNPSDPGGNTVQGEEDNEDDEDKDIVDAGVGVIVPGIPGQADNQLARRIAKGKKKKKTSQISPKTFSKIRIRIIEGRQLSGNNIKPVVKVTIGGQTHRTRIKRGNNPYFDEIFFYNINMTPLELLDESVVIRLYNSGTIRADSLIGEFKLDIGYIYDEPGHAVMRKWVLLNDPDDSSSGAKGYLKVSMFILGTGDEPPNEKRDREMEDDDVESNLLLPAGVALRWVTFLLKIYRAEDIPQMDDAFVQTVKQIFGADSDKKNLVDPFVEVSFAGKKVCTNKIEKNANPEWNQAVNLQIKFPSMCENIRLTVFDWDRLTKNDAVGTTSLSLSKIAASGGDYEATTEKEVGFLPTFGPCYVNLYGSPREYTGFPDPYDELNYGKGEGVSYRGRVLVELTTKMDITPNKKIEEIPSDDVLIVEKYQRRRKFCLCAIFHSATMLQDVGEAIQFEVSIGNYGNKFDNTCKPLASTTQYSRPIFDGNFYYYLPWAAKKPVVTLTSYWEDISHRLDIVNILLAMTDRLQSNISALKAAIQAKLPEARLAEIWLKLIDQIIEDTMKPMPSLDEKPNITALDKQREKLRQFSIKHIQEAAVKMRGEATDVKATLSDIEDWLDKLQQLADEPQNSMPDIIIWMIRAEKRLAYARVPAHHVLFSKTSEDACGKFCGKTQTVYLQYPLDKNKGIKIPVQLRVNVWLGLSVDEKKFNSYAQGTYSVYAEMYENQALLLGKWGTTGLLKHPKCSDVTGSIKLKRESFLPPKSWEWEDDWRVDPERSLLTEADAGHSEFTDEIYENEARYPGGEWKKAEETYTDTNGEKTVSPSEFGCPFGWMREDDGWRIDINRAVDENGWEYGITIPPDSKPKSWVAAEKMYHTHRRRRLVCKRKKDPKAISSSKMVLNQQEDEGWEYAALVGWKFHVKQRGSDTFRRRRWRRKMAPSDQHGAAAIFKLEGALGTDMTGDEESKGGEKQTPTDVFGANTPMISCTFDRVYTYHLRCYVYQARGLTALDKDSFSDPYAYISFLHRSKTTEVVRSTLNPTWDQTLIFDTVDIYGDPLAIAQNPPNIVVEIFDYDQVGKDEFLGRSVCLPIVKLNPEIDITPKLLWYPVLNANKHCGDLLVAAELIMREKDGSNLPILPSKRSAQIYMVPQGIRPVVQLTAIEILTWGLRNMKSYQLASVTSPSLIVECGGEIVESAVIRNLKKTPNFQSSILFMKVLLPKEEMYVPPIIIKIIDHRPFGRKPVVGQCTIEQLEDFRCDPYSIKREDAPEVRVARLTSSSPRDVVIEVEDTKPLLSTQLLSSISTAVGKMTSATTVHEEEVVDWWSKYYASIGEHDKCGQYVQKGYATLKVYNRELENVPEFRGLTDFCDTFKLYRGKAEDNDDPSVVGEFKGAFHIYPLSDDPSVQPPRQFIELPGSDSQECSNIHYLKIAVYDYDALTRDEKVGETTIDLENRFLSRFGSHCGLPQTYCISGMNLWRDQLKPTQILQNFAKLKSSPPPVYSDSGTRLTFLGREYTIEEFETNKKIHLHLWPENERLALYVLRNQGLVPEHVETRTLYSTFQPNIPQGKLEMWVDVFPKSLGPPGPPFNIIPRKPKKQVYILRVIVWNTKDVILDEKSINGEEMSDIYVKGWIPGNEENKQKTDVHYRSLDGEGNFNWRFVFPFEYLPAEQLCIISKKEHFWSLDKTEFKLLPKLILQIWDNDKFSLDDYLGFIEFDLHRIILPSKVPEKCTLDVLDLVKTPKVASLFEQKSMRGWWPCYAEKSGIRVLAGKVDLTLEVLNEKEADERPAGKGRDEPNMNPKLDPPNRPDTSFLWFTNPCKTMKFIVWRRFKWYFIGGIIILFLVLFLAVFLYSLPGYVSMKIVKPNT